MSSVLALFFVAGAPVGSELPVITIDPCVEVDAEEVRRLTAMELRGLRWRISPGELEVVAACENGGQQLELTHRVRGLLTVRSIDLAESGEGVEDAKERELALAIAELLRRADVESAPEPPLAPVVPPPSTQTPAVTPVAPSPEPRPWNIELGAGGVFTGWTGGEVLFGADIVGRVHAGRWLITELRLGGRKSRPVDLENGSVDGQGVSGAVGVSFDATPGVRSAGVSFGARIGGDFLRYTAVDKSGVPYGGGDATAVTLSGTTTGYVALSRALCLTVDAAVGGAMHSVAIRENDELLSGLRGVVLSGAVGLGAHF